MIGAALTLAGVALVPTVYGLLALASGAPDDTATLMLGGRSAVLLFVALIPAAYSERQLKQLRTRFRAGWGLPDELQMKRFSDEIPTPGERLD